MIKKGAVFIIQDYTGDVWIRGAAEDIDQAKALEEFQTEYPQSSLSTRTIRFIDFLDENYLTFDPELERWEIEWQQ
jgi:hypothetical protein